MKILFVGFRDKRHSSAGGYDKIAQYPQSSYISDKQVPLGSIPVGKRGKSINLFFLDIYSRFIRCKFDIVHIFYGDNIIFPYLKSKKHKIVATIHLDIEQRTRFPKLFIKSLRSLNGVIVLSSQQEKILKEKYEINACFIPHGFSMPNFVCQSSRLIEKTNFNSNFINIFYSGTNYRDLDILIEIINLCHKKKLNIFFHLVGQDKHIVKNFNLCTNYILYDRLTDDEYFSLLSLCDYNFLPLTFATANNALLEAQFLGIKSILPDIAGIEDYASSSYNLFYESLDCLENIFNGLTKSEPQQGLKEFSRKFLWENIYKQLDSFYNSL